MANYIPARGRVAHYIKSKLPASTSGPNLRPVSIVWLMFAGVCAPFGYNVIATLLPAIRVEFSLDQSRMQWMVSIFSFTLALGQLISGPLADMFGRRRIFLVGVLIFTLGSLGAACAADFTQLLAYRVVQGLGACVTLVIPRAVVRDRYSGADAAHAMALITISFSVTPAVAPVVGGVLQAWFGWRAGFVGCAVIGALLLAFAYRLHGETHAADRRVRVSLPGMLTGYGNLLRSWRFCAYALSFSLLNCCFIGFFVIGPGFLTHAYGMTPVAAATAMLAPYVGFAAGNLMAAGFVRRAGVERILAAGLAFTLTGTLTLMAGADSQILAWLLGALFMQSLGIGLTFPVGIAGATSVFPERAGTASALVGAVQMLCGALFAIVAGIIDDGSLRPLARADLLLCLISAACIWPLYRRRGPIA